MDDPVRVFDVAEHILQKAGTLSTWKLQKLCYYSQAWSLVWDDEPLFLEEIQAWANGPVVRDLYLAHRTHFSVSPGFFKAGDAGELDEEQALTVDIVLRDYGDLSAAELSAMTHNESPWRRARRRAGLSLGQRGKAVILLGDMAEYYGGLYAEAYEED